MVNYQSDVVPEVYPWLVKDLSYTQERIILLTLEIDFEERVLTEMELIWASYLSFKLKAPFPERIIASAMQRSDEEYHPAILFLLTIFFAEGYGLFPKDRKRAMDSRLRLYRTGFKDAFFPYVDLFLEHPHPARNIEGVLAILIEKFPADPRATKYRDALKLMLHKDVALCRRELAMIEEKEKDPRAALFLGIYYKSVKNYEEAFRHLDYGAKLGDTECKKHCGFMTIMGTGVKPSVSLATIYLRDCHNDVLAMYYTGKILYRNGVKDSEHDCTWYLKRAYDMGSIHAGKILIEIWDKDPKTHEKAKKIKDALSDVAYFLRQRPMHEKTR